MCAGSLADAQTASTPPLHRRGGPQPAENSPDLALFDASRSTLPPDVSGEYLIDEVGSTIEITLDAGKISGYVTRMGDEQSDKDTPLTFFFDRATANGDRVSFATRKVHGIWYEFDGSILRGDMKATRAENGYYRLKGKWTTYDGRRSAALKEEEVSLKSTPRQLQLGR
jgi:hypothetical protein